MERLTFFRNGRWWILLNETVYGGFPEVDRLAAYEDIGLEPEEIKDILERYHAFRSAVSDETGQPMVGWTRAGEICRAEKDGRLVVLPPNDPLTLEELREMDGEPVFIKRMCALFLDNLRRNTQ